MMNLLPGLPHIPDNIPQELHKNFKMLVGIDCLCILVHAYMIYLFHDLGIPFMRRFNYFSVIWFFLILIFLFRNKKNRWFCASYGIMVEVLVHQSLAVIFMGVDSGFQYFILVSAVCFTYFPEKKRYRYIRLALSALAILTYLLLSLHSREAAPLYPVSEQRLTSLFIMCCSLSLAMISGVMYASCRANEKAFEQLREKNRQIVLASEAKVNFLANMSHEIRTPMNAILGMTDLILSEPVSGAVREKTENIYSASRSLLTIINDILDFSKIESGKMKVINAEYRLSYILSDIYFLMAPRAETKAVNLNVHIDGEVPDRLIGDEIRLKQILLNLVSNAVKYTDRGSVTIRVSGRKTGNGVNLKLAVEDTGIGIRPADMDRLFSSFTQVNTRQNRTIEGTGLGLAISKQLVTLMGGFTNVQSEFGKGSVFTCVIPQGVADPAPMQFECEKHHVIEDIRAKNIRMYNFTAPQAKILVVDDVDMNLRVAKGLLAPYRMQVDTAPGGRECMEMLQESRDYDIVFMDHMMPGLDGVDTTKLIRADMDEYYQKLPVIALTANVLTEAKNLLLESGMNDFIVKPIDMHDMYRVLLRWLPEDKIIYRMEEQDEFDLSAAENGQAAENTDLELPGVDIRQGLSFSGGRKQYLEFLSIFCESADKLLKRLQQAALAEDWKQYEIDAHALKSTSAGIGANAVSELAMKLERAAREDHEYVRSAAPELVQMTEKLLRAIRDTLPEMPDQNIIEVSAADELIPELEKFSVSVEQYLPDMGLLEGLLKKECSGFPEYSGCLKSIRDTLNRFDYEAASGQIQSLLSGLKGGDGHGED